MNTLYSKFIKYVHDKDVEIEIRLGKQRRSGFDTDIGHSVYKQIKSDLDSFDGWANVQELNYTDYFYDNSIRITKDSCIQKTVLASHIHKFSKSFDFKVAFNKEIYIPVPQSLNNIRYTRSKQRTRYFYKFFVIDLTYISNLETYELEIEIIDLSYARSHRPEFIIDCLFKNLTCLIQT